MNSFRDLRFGIRFLTQSSALSPMVSALNSYHSVLSPLFLSVSYTQSSALSPLVLNGGLVPAYPELPYKQGPELLSIILFVEEMILKESGHIFRIEESFSFYSIG